MGRSLAGTERGAFKRIFALAHFLVRFPRSVEQPAPGGPSFRPAAPDFMQEFPARQRAVLRCRRACRSAGVAVIGGTFRLSRKGAQPTPLRARFTPASPSLPAGGPAWLP